MAAQKNLDIEWEVWRQNRLIDNLIYPASMNEKAVLLAVVNDVGYPPDVKVKRKDV